MKYEWNNIYNEDCMIAMKQMPDNFADLCIVDPPYFDGPQKRGYYKGTKQRTDVGDYKDLSDSWNPPTDEYFNELMRVSNNQIIWGINYFNIALPGGRIVWIKGVENSPFSMADIAYQSFYNRIDMFRFLWSGYWQGNMKQKEKRTHPTQKPVALYKWLLKNYAKEGDKILDTHMGSGSLEVACYDMGFDYIAFEVDYDYFDKANERIEANKAQLRLSI